MDPAESFAGRAARRGVHQVDHALHHADQLIADNLAVASVAEVHARVMQYESLFDQGPGTLRGSRR